MKKEFQLTQQGVDALKAELSKLIGSRKDIAEKLKTARGFGDLSENTEYHNARDEQVSLESRISEIEHILQSVEIIKKAKNKNVVEIGDTVELSGNGTDRKFMIVGSVEANPLENKISNESPIGKALLGKKVSEKVEIVLPAGATTYTVKKVS